MAQGKAALHEDPLRPFTVQRNGSPLLLTPVLASGADADAKLREVAISLFRHVLPGVGRRFMRKLLASERATTLLLMRSAEDVLAERRRHLAALQAAPAASSDKEDEEGSEKTSSFSGPSGSGSGSGEDEAGGADGSAGGRSPPAGGEVSSCSEGDDEALRGAPAEAAAVRLKHRVVGAASWEMVPEPQCPRGSERVLQLTLIGVRTKFQSCGLGAQLIRRALSPRLSGLHDATIAFADHDAVPFFRRHGFSDDAILTSRFRAVADAWDQSVLMLRADLRAPPRGVSGGGADDPLLQSPSDLAEPRYLAGDDLRASVDEWRALKVETYSSELALVERLRAEVVLLRARAVKQDDYVRFLKAENTQLHRQRGALAEDVAGLRAELAARDPRAQPPRPQPQQPREGAQPPSGADASTSAGASAESSRRGLSSTLAPLDAQAAESCRVAAAFAASLRPGEHACGSLSVVRVWQLASDQRRNARRLGFEAAVRAAAGAQAAAADQPLELYLGAPVEVLQHVSASPGCAPARVGGRASPRPAVALAPLNQSAPPSSRA